MKIFWITILSLVCVYSCETKTKKKEDLVAEASPDTEISEDLILTLSEYYISNPKVLAHHEQNEIIDYAMANGLSLTKTKSGLFYMVTSKGNGAPLSWGEKIKVHYKGEFLNGDQFDSSHKRRRPLEFRIGEMIPAWNEGMKLLAHGDSAILISPSHLAYGKEGLAPLVGPDRVLVFTLEIF